MDRQSLIGLNHYKNRENILILETATAQKANEVISEILVKYSDFKTALFLSGGSTPKKLYEQFAADKKIKAGAVGQIDERYGARNHKNSNELMIENTGLTAYFESLNIRFYPILQPDADIENTAREYDEALRFIFKYFPKSVGILGIGEDGHTAGIPAVPEIALKMLEDQSELVDFYEAEKYGPRITMNFHGISMLDLIIVLVLGQEKREILAKVFKEGMIDDLPARYFLTPGIAEKTIIVTDQIV
jgi:6-phosphogluconolactonase/glucosamine-6-phosphate isomerase/deaminase